MINESILQLLQQHYPHLAEKSLREEIATEGKIFHFEPGEIIMDFGSYVRMVPLIVSGSIKVVREEELDARELFLYYVTAGETCSMSFSCCMMSKKSDIRTIAEDHTTLIGIPVKHVDDWMSKYASWKRFVMRSYDERMQELVKTIDNIAFKQMDERLLQYLRQKAKAIHANTFNITHQEIADDLNASREGISRLLKKLEHDGVVVLGRHQIELVSQE